MAETPKKVLTPEDVRDYIAKSGNYCPYCSSDEIEGRSHDVDGPSAIQTVVCNDCNETWDDVYFLGAVSITDADGDNDDWVMPAPPTVDPFVVRKIRRRWKDLVDSAIAHGENDDPGHAVGDLETFLLSMARLLDAGQLEAFWADADVKAILATIPEYEELAKEIYRI
jgi:hypothetical protein